MHRHPHGGVEGEERGVHRDPVLPRSTVHPDVRLEEGNGHTVGQVQKDLDPVVARAAEKRGVVEEARQSVAPGPPEEGLAFRRRCESVVAGRSEDGNKGREVRRRLCGHDSLRKND